MDSYSKRRSLYDMVNRKVKSLLYRGTRDGFGSSAFDFHCDGKDHTVSIILNDQNHVFGGYLFFSWRSSDTYSRDPYSNLFSLRRCLSTKNEKYLFKSQYPIYWTSRYGPMFGAGYDIYICDNAYINKCSRNTKRSYEIPSTGYLSGASDRI